MLYSDEQYKLFREELDGASIGTVWSAMRADNFDRNTLSYEEKKNYFFDLIHHLMAEGRVRLGKHGQFLEGDIEEQVTHYKAVFPKTEEEWKKMKTFGSMKRNALVVLSGFMKTAIKIGRSY